GQRHCQRRNPRVQCPPHRRERLADDGGGTATAASELHAMSTMNTTNATNTTTTQPTFNLLASFDRLANEQADALRRIFRAADVAVAPEADAPALAELAVAIAGIRR